MRPDLQVGGSCLPTPAEFRGNSGPSTIQAPFSVAASQMPAPVARFPMRCFFARFRFRWNMTCFPASLTPLNATSSSGRVDVFYHLFLERSTTGSLLTKSQKTKLKKVKRKRSFDLAIPNAGRTVAVPGLLGIQNPFVFVGSEWRPANGPIQPHVRGYSTSYLDNHKRVHLP